MRKNITFSANKDLIEKGRRLAEVRQTTLNNEFELWLESYVRAPEKLTQLAELIKKMDYVSAGNQWNRDELNGR